MDPLSRVTGATIDVLACLVDSPEPTWGLQIIKAAARPAGTVYPILERLERAGWVTSAWEESDDRPGPRRRFYRLTAEGEPAAAAAVAAFRKVEPRRAARVAEAGA